MTDKSRTDAQASRIETAADSIERATAALDRCMDYLAMTAEGMRDVARVCAPELARAQVVALTEAVKVVQDQILSFERRMTQLETDYAARLSEARDSYRALRARVDALPLNGRGEPMSEG